MRAAIYCVSLGFALALGFPSPTRREIVDNLDYSELQKEADVVVIGAFEKAVTADQSLIDAKYRERLTVRQSTLKIAWVIKGMYDKKTIDVIHVQYTDEGQASFSGKIRPLKFEERKEWRGVKGGAYGTTVDYLVFLKAVPKKNYFMPASGLLDSASSVKIMYRPFPNLQD